MPKIAVNLLSLFNFPFDLLLTFAVSPNPPAPMKNPPNSGRLIGNLSDQRLGDQATLRDEGIYVALGERTIAYVGEEESTTDDITVSPPQAWKYFGPSKTRPKSKVKEIREEKTTSEETSIWEPPNGAELTYRTHKEIPQSQTHTKVELENKTLHSQILLSQLSEELESEKIEKLGYSDLSAHRPTTLEITSSSTDSAENDSNELSATQATTDAPDRKSAVKIMTVGGMKQERGIGEGLEGAVAVVRPQVVDGSTVSRQEPRPPRAAPRTATLVKVKVEKRPVGFHGRSERSQTQHDSAKDVCHATAAESKMVASVEEELAGLMADMKAATSQIKKEVKQIRQSDTPTPDTPTPLREFQDFLCKEEEQELARLPTITELQREIEDDSTNAIVVPVCNIFRILKTMPGLPKSHLDDSEVQAINGEEIEDHTDEELLPTSDAKSSHLCSEKAEGLTDTEIVNASGEDEEEDEKLDDAIDALEFVPDLKNEIVNLTEGFKGTEPQLSASDVDDNSSMHGRHKRNVAATEKLMATEDQNIDGQVPTDSENMDDSDDEKTASDEHGCDTGVPDIYLEHGNHVSSAAVKHVSLPTRKSQHFSSSSKLKKGKLSPPHEQDEGVTEEEELANKVNPTLPANKRVLPTKTRRKKPAKKTVSYKSTKKVKCSKGDLSDYETDSESLADDKSDDEGFVVGDSTLGYLTDTEDCVASGDELDIRAQPILKDVPFKFPEPHCEVVKVDERPDIETEVRQEDTDEEGFEIGEREDNAPLVKALCAHSAVVKDVDYTTEAEETASDVATDDDDLDFEDDEKRDILFELNTWRRAEDSNVLEKMDCGSGTESSIGKWKSAVSNVIKTSSTIRSLKMCLPSNFSFDELEESDDAANTDEENLNEKGEVISCQPEPSQKPTDEDASSVTSNESLQASDNEILDEREYYGQKENDSGLAELRFIETDKGSLNIVIGPDRLNDPNAPEILDSVPGVMFLEDDDDNATDEEIVKPADAGPLINVYPSTPLTDVEDFDDERGDISRPGTPIPHEIEYSVLSSPKRERIHIKEDKYGVPQVKIETMNDELLTATQDIERPNTATEDIEITLDEALRIFGIHDNEKEACQDLADNSEITSRLRHKIMRHLSEPGSQPTEGGTTDEEEVILRKKRGKKGKRASKQNREQHGTDEELLSERDSEGARCDQADKTLPVISTDEDTDSENFEVSAMEDILDEEPKYPMETPEIIRRAAVKRTEIYKEGPNHTTGNVIVEPAQARSAPLEFLAPLTDTEDLEASAAEDMYEQGAEGEMSLEGERTKITQSEEVVAVAQDHPAIKENLLYTNVCTNTDVESLDGVEGHRWKSEGAKSGEYGGRGIDLIFSISLETEAEAPVARDVEATAPASAAARVLDLEEAGSAERDNSKGTACREEIRVQSTAVSLKGTTPQADTTPIPLITPLIENSSSAESTSKKYPPTSKLKCTEDSGLLSAGMVDPSMNKNESMDYKPEEQDERLIMRDSPRWEEEEIKAEERQDPRIIKAEVKLLVRTTESGKETIEIRSIEEFVEIAEKYPGGFSENVASKAPDTDKLAPVEEKVFTLHRKSPARSPSPRFVRPLGIEEGSYISEATADEFNLMSQIRDDALGYGTSLGESQNVDKDSVATVFSGKERLVKSSVHVSEESSNASLPNVTTSVSTFHVSLPKSVSASATSVVTSVKNSKTKSVRIEDVDVYDSDRQSFEGSSIYVYPKSLGVTSTSAVSITDATSRPSSHFAPNDGQSDLLSPADESSEDQAEMDRTSTEENNRFEPDVLDTRTEDEAPDIDDDIFPVSGIHGPYLSERLLSVEATEDTDITTPMEMRECQTEKDTNASQLESEGGGQFSKNVSDNSQNDTNEKEISDFQELPASYIEGDNKEEPTSEAKDSEVFIDDAAEPRAVAMATVHPPLVLENETLEALPKNLNVSTDFSNVWPTEESRKARRTESTVVETGSNGEGSPSDSKSRDRSFSDLVDSDEVNRDSLEDEFDKLVAEADSPSSVPSLHNDPIVDEYPPTTHSKSSNLIPSSSLQPTILEADHMEVILRDPSGSVRVGGGRPVTFPQCLLDVEQRCQSPEAEHYYKEQEKAIRDMALRGIHLLSSEVLEADEPTTAPANVEIDASLSSDPTDVSGTFTAFETVQKSDSVSTDTDMIQVEISDASNVEVGVPGALDSVMNLNQGGSGSVLAVTAHVELDTQCDGSDVLGGESPRKLVKSSSSYENIYDNTTLDAVTSENNPPAFTLKKTLVPTKPASSSSTVLTKSSTISEEVPGRIIRRHERTYSQTTNIFTKTTTEGKEEIVSELDTSSVAEDVKPYSERKQFWETVSSQGSDSKRSSIIRSETESDSESIGKISRPTSGYENVAFVGSKNVDETTFITESSSPYEVQRSEQRSSDLPSPEDISLKDVKTKRELFESEIKKQSVDSDDSTGRRALNQSSSDESSEGKDSLPDDKAKVSKILITSSTEKTDSSEKSRLEIQPKLITFQSSSSEKSDSYTGSLDRSSEVYSSLDRTSSTVDSGSSEFKTSGVTSSLEAESTDDVTRTGESSDEETQHLLPEKKTTEERRDLGDVQEVVIRETTTTRTGGQEQRVIRETKTQETQLADGSKVKSTSITTFTTQLDEIKKEVPTNFGSQLARAESQERQMSMLEQRVKSDIFQEEISSPADELSPERKILTPKSSLPIDSQKSLPALSSPIHVPEESVHEIVWEVSQERSEIPDSETVDYIPDQYLSEGIVSGTDDQYSSSITSTVIRLSEEEARRIAIEIVEEVKSEALKRSPTVTPGRDNFIAKRSSTLQSESAESSFSEDTAQKIDKFIQEQLGEQPDETQKALIESIASRKAEMLQQKLSTFQHSLEITDEDLRSSAAELSPVEHHMERLKQMAEDDDTMRSIKDPSEADESEGSMIIHDSLDDSFTNEYDQANQMISKTLDTIQVINLKGERTIPTISEEVSESDASLSLGQEAQVIKPVDASLIGSVKKQVEKAAGELKSTVSEGTEEVTDILQNMSKTKSSTDQAELSKLTEGIAPQIVETQFREAAPLKSIEAFRCDDSIPIVPIGIHGAIDIHQPLRPDLQEEERVLVPQSKIELKPVQGGIDMKTYDPKILSKERQSAVAKVDESIETVKKTVAEKVEAVKKEAEDNKSELLKQPVTALKTEEKVDIGTPTLEITSLVSDIGRLGKEMTPELEESVDLTLEASPDDEQGLAKELQEKLSPETEEVDDAAVGVLPLLRLRDETSLEAIETPLLGIHGAIDIDAPQTTQPKKDGKLTSLTKGLKQSAGLFKKELFGHKKEVEDAAVGAKAKITTKVDESTEDVKATYKKTDEKMAKAVDEAKAALSTETSTIRADVTKAVGKIEEESDNAAKVAETTATSVEDDVELTKIYVKDSFEDSSESAERSVVKIKDQLEKQVEDVQFKSIGIHGSFDEGDSESETKSESKLFSFKKGLKSSAGALKRELFSFKRSSKDSQKSFEDKTSAKADDSFDSLGSAPEIERKLDEKDATVNVRISGEFVAPKQASIGDISDITAEADAPKIDEKDKASRDERITREISGVVETSSDFDDSLVVGVCGAIDIDGKGDDIPTSIFESLKESAISKQVAVIEKTVVDSKEIASSSLESTHQAIVTGVKSIGQDVETTKTYTSSKISDFKSAVCDEGKRVEGQVEESVEKIESLKTEAVAHEQSGGDSLDNILDKTSLVSQKLDDAIVDMKNFLVEETESYEVTPIGIHGCIDEESSETPKSKGKLTSITKGIKDSIFGGKKSAEEATKTSLDKASKKAADTADTMGEGLQKVSKEIEEVKKSVTSTIVDKTAVLKSEISPIQTESTFGVSLDQTVNTREKVQEVETAFVKVAEKVSPILEQVTDASVQLKNQLDSSVENIDIPVTGIRGAIDIHEKKGIILSSSHEGKESSGLLKKEYVEVDNKSVVGIHGAIDMQEKKGGILSSLTKDVKTSPSLIKKEVLSMKNDEDIEKSVSSKADEVASVLQSEAETIGRDIKQAKTTTEEFISKKASALSQGADEAVHGMEEAVTADIAEKTLPVLKKIADSSVLLENQLDRAVETLDTSVVGICGAIDIHDKKTIISDSTDDKESSSYSHRELVELEDAPVTGIHGAIDIHEKKGGILSSLTKGLKASPSLIKKEVLGLKKDAGGVVRGVEQSVSSKTEEVQVGADKVKKDLEETKRVKEHVVDAVSGLSVEVKEVKREISEDIISASQKTADDLKSNLNEVSGIVGGELNQEINVIQVPEKLDIIATRINNQLEKEEVDYAIPPVGIHGSIDEDSTEITSKSKQKLSSLTKGIKDSAGAIKKELFGTKKTIDEGVQKAGEQISSEVEEAAKSIKDESTELVEKIKGKKQEFESDVIQEASQKDIPFEEIKMTVTKLENTLNKPADDFDATVTGIQGAIDIHEKESRIFSSLTKDEESPSIKKDVLETTTPIIGVCGAIDINEKKGMFTSLTEGMKEAQSSVKKGAFGMKDSTIETVATIKEKVSSEVDDAVEALQKKTVSVEDDIDRSVGSAQDRMDTEMVSLKTVITTEATTLETEIASGLEEISKKTSLAESKVSELIESSKDTAEKGFEEIQKTSRDLQDVAVELESQLGKEIGDFVISPSGIHGGIDTDSAEVPKTKGKISSFTKGIKDSIFGSKKTATDAAKHVQQKIDEHVESARTEVQSLEETLDNQGKTAVESIQSLKSELVSTGKQAQSDAKEEVKQLKGSLDDTVEDIGRTSFQLKDQLSGATEDFSTVVSGVHGAIDIDGKKDGLLSSMTDAMKQAPKTMKKEASALQKECETGLKEAGEKISSVIDRKLRTTESEAQSFREETESAGESAKQFATEGLSDLQAKAISVGQKQQTEIDRGLATVKDQVDATVSTALEVGASIKDDVQLTTEKILKISREEEMSAIKLQDNLTSAEPPGYEITPVGIHGSIDEAVDTPVKTGGMLKSFMKDIKGSADDIKKGVLGTAKKTGKAVEDAQEKITSEADHAVTFAEKKIEALEKDKDTVESVVSQKASAVMSEVSDVEAKLKSKLEDDVKRTCEQTSLKGEEIASETEGFMRSVDETITRTLSPMEEMLGKKSMQLEDRLSAVAADFTPVVTGIHGAIDIHEKKSGVFGLFTKSSTEKPPDQIDKTEAVSTTHEATGTREEEKSGILGSLVEGIKQAPSILQKEIKGLEKDGENFSKDVRETLSSTAVEAAATTQEAADTTKQTIEAAIFAASKEADGLITSSEKEAQKMTTSVKKAEEIATAVKKAGTVVHEGVEETVSAVGKETEELKDLVEKPTDIAISDAKHIGEKLSDAKKSAMEFVSEGTTALGSVVSTDIRKLETESTVISKRVSKDSDVVQSTESVLESLQQCRETVDSKTKSTVESIEEKVESKVKKYSTVVVSSAEKLSSESSLLQENIVQKIEDIKKSVLEDVRQEYTILEGSIDDVTDDVTETVQRTLTEAVDHSTTEIQTVESSKQKIFSITRAGYEKLSELSKSSSESSEDAKQFILHETKETKPEVRESFLGMQQRSLELHRDQHMESSMTESMEESSAAESTRAYETRMITETTSKSLITNIKELDESPTEKVSEVVMRKKKGPLVEFNRRSGQDIDTTSSSGDSHYYTSEGTPDSHSGSRPCSSDVEALLSATTGTTGTSEYETALSSQECSRKSQPSSTSGEYRTAATSISSRDSMKSLDSESSGNLGSIELSEASETLVPSSLELERDMELLDQEILEEELRRSQYSKQIIPQLTVQSETPKTEESPSGFEIDSDELDDSELKDDPDVQFIASKMKRSVEMTFHPDPQPYIEDSTTEISKSTGSLGDTISSEGGSVKLASSLEESTISEASGVTILEASVSPRENAEKITVSTTSHDHRSVSTAITSESIQSVTISATSVPSSYGQTTASMCTQVTSETKTETKSNEQSFFRVKGPAEADEVAKLDKVTESRPVDIPQVAYAAIGAPTGPTEGPERHREVDECFDTEADQQYGHKIGSRKFSSSLEFDLSVDDLDDSLNVGDLHERPKTPEPGSKSSVRPPKMSEASADDAEDMTEVDQRFSAVFSMTYEDSRFDDPDIDIPNITITEDIPLIVSQGQETGREGEALECRESLASSQSSVTSPKSSTTDSDRGREYCLDSGREGPGSFEIVDFVDIVDLSEFEQTMYLHEERVREVTLIREEDEEIIDSSSAPLIPHTIKAVKLDPSSHSSSESHSLESEERVGQYETSIEEQRKWLEMQFEKGQESPATDYSPPKFLDHVYAGPLEDIEEEREDGERRDLSVVAKGTSLSSTPEYDVLAGKKFFTRSGEHDDVSVCSLQEFERLEREMALEIAARRSSSGSQESLNGKRPMSKNSQGDDVSVASLNSLNEFENLENQCVFIEQIEKKAMEEVAMLSEIEEGHESQLSESESCETISDEDDDEKYADRIFQIDEIIRQAQDNVEKFEGAQTSYQGVRLKDIASADRSTISSDRSPSVGPDPDSLEENSKSILPSTSGMAGRRLASQDSLDKFKSDRMTASTDSLELSIPVKDPMRTSVDSLDTRKKLDAMTVSTDSIDPGRAADVMATSVDSLGKDDSSGREGDISSASEMMSRHGGGGMMEWSTDSLEPTSSLATHATYHDNDSVMSSSFASGCSNTLMGSADESAGDLMTASMYIPEGELPSGEMHEHFTRMMMSGEAFTTETIVPSTEAGFSQVSRSVVLPPEIREVKFTGKDAKQKMEEYMHQFNEGEHVTEEEKIDDMGNVHVQRVVQRRLIVDPDETEELGFKLCEPSTEETVMRDKFGNVTRVIKRTVVSTHTVEINLDTGEPILTSADEEPFDVNEYEMHSQADLASDASASASQLPLSVSPSVVRRMATEESVALPSGSTSSFSSTTATKISTKTTMEPGGGEPDGDGLVYANPFARIPPGGVAPHTEGEEDDLHSGEQEREQVSGEAYESPISDYEEEEEENEEHCAESQRHLVDDDLRRRLSFNEANEEEETETRDYYESDENGQINDQSIDAENSSQQENIDESNSDDEFVVVRNPVVSFAENDVVIENPTALHENPSITLDTEDLVVVNPAAYFDEKDFVIENPAVSFENADVSTVTPTISFETSGFSFENPAASFEVPSDTHVHDYVTVQSDDIDHDASECVGGNNTETTAISETSDSLAHHNHQTDSDDSNDGKKVFVRGEGTFLDDDDREVDAFERISRNSSHEQVPEQGKKKTDEVGFAAALASETISCTPSNSNSFVEKVQESKLEGDAEGAANAQH
ncbi:hypothetical protein FHG87_011724 [Trinorchestia longiramus]|nr:hypothetical protein FHG87_011724 [Trinorchestia longiramus]